MREFLRSLQGGALPGGLRSELPGRFGEESLAALIAEGVLVPGERSHRYPCPRKNTHCPRKVVENPGDPERPFLAIPPNGVKCCEPVPLTAAELETLQTSRSSLVELLRRLFAVTGQADLQTEVFPGAYLLGRAVWRELERDVLYSTDLNEKTSGASAHLELLKLRQQPTLVLAPAWTRYTSQAVRSRFGPTEIVEVVYLEQVLTTEGERVVLREPHGGHGAPNIGSYTPLPSHLTAAEPRSQYHPQGSPYCVLIDGDGRHEVDEAIYREVASRMREYDLYIDLLTTVSAGRYRSGHSDENGVFVETSLTQQQAWAYAELVERRKPLRASELRVLSTYGASHKQVEAARRAVDLKLGPNRWRSTELVSRGAAKLKEYLFKPPDGLRLAVICPLGAHSSRSS